MPSPGHQCASAQSVSEVHVELPVADDVPAAQGLQLDWFSTANFPAMQATQASTPLCEQPGALERPDGQSAHLLHWTELAPGHTDRIPSWCCPAPHPV